MSRESAFSAMDNNNMNTALNDYFGGLARPTDPVGLMKENDERNEYNEKLLELTGAVGAPFIEQGIHGSTQQLLKGVKYAIGRTGKTVLGKLGITPEKFQEYAKRYGLSDQTLKDLSEGKINLTKLAKGGLDEAFQKLGSAKNIPTDLVRPAGPILTQSDKEFHNTLRSNLIGGGDAGTELTDLTKLPERPRIGRKPRRGEGQFGRMVNAQLEETRGNLKGNLQEKYSDTGDLFGRVQKANVNKGRLLDPNVRVNNVRSKLPVNRDLILEDANPFTGEAITNKIKNKVKVSGIKRNDDLSSVELPEKWSPGKAGVQSADSVRQQRKLARRAQAKGAQAVQTLNAANEEQAKRLEGIAARRARKTKPIDEKALEDPLKKAKARDPGFELGTSNPYDYRVYDSAEATAAREELENQFRQSEADSTRHLALIKHEEGLPVDPSILPSLNELIKPSGSEPLTAMAGKSKLPSGPIENGQEGYTRQQVKILDTAIQPKNVQPVVEETKIATQAKPGAELRDEGVRVGPPVLGAVPGAAFAAAVPGQTEQQRGISAGEAVAQDVGGSALTSLTGVEEAGLVPGAALAAGIGGGTIAQRAERGGIVGAQQEAPKVAGSLVRAATSQLSSAAETEGGDVADQSVNLGLKDEASAAARAAAKAAGQSTEKSLGKDAAESAAKALATAGETEAELGGPEDPIADIVSLGLGLGTLFGGLGGVEHQKLPTYRTPINPSVVYGI